MALPIVTVTLPSDLVGVTNGNLPSSLLASVDGGGTLHHIAARAWTALVAAADDVGLPLTFTHGGTYRTYSAQEVLFRARYAVGGVGGGCKYWQGQRWCKKSANLATAATPGTSNHGLGIAIDSAAGLGPSQASAIASHPQWPWLLANADRFGFSWELQSEPWHLRYVTGDAIPQAVRDFETPTPDPIPQPTEDEMPDFIAQPTFAGVKPYETPWLAFFPSGAIRRSYNVDYDNAKAKGIPILPFNSQDQHADACAKNGIANP